MRPAIDWSVAVMQQLEKYNKTGNKNHNAYLFTFIELHLNPGNINPFSQTSELWWDC